MYWSGDAVADARQWNADQDAAQERYTSRNADCCECGRTIEEDECVVFYNSSFKERYENALCESCAHKAVKLLEKNGLAYTADYLSNEFWWLREKTPNPMNEPGFEEREEE